MHKEANAFVRKVFAHYQNARRFASPPTVLEIGSYNVNGSVRPIFEGAASYTGIDVREGPDVDQVIRAQDYTADPPVDIVVCCEVMEHDPDPAGIIACAERSLKPNGLLILTMASPERLPHGCDGQPIVPESEHYGNIDQHWLRSCLMAGGWVAVHMEHYPLRGDLYAVAERPTPPTPAPEDGEPPAAMPEPPAAMPEPPAIELPSVQPSRRGAGGSSDAT